MVPTYISLVIVTTHLIRYKTFIFGEKLVGQGLPGLSDDGYATASLTTV